MEIYTKKDVLSVSGEFGIVNQINLQGRSFAGESIKEYHIVETNDIVYTKSPLKENLYGIIKVNKGIPGIVSTLYAVYHIKNTVFPEYIDYYFSNNLRLNKYLKPLVNIGAKHSMQLNNETFLKGYVTFPKIEEQQKISTFLSLIDKRIEKQHQLIENLKKYKRGLSNKIFGSISDDKKIPLSKLISAGYIYLNRGNIIPKYTKSEKRIYPVYSSSTHNNGLMGYFESYMFDKEAITWSIDGGGNFFYRKKHKFNVTNVCGIIELNTKIYNYKYIAEALIYQHARKHFDYLSKAHPSVIVDMYYIPQIGIKEQEKFAKIFSLIDEMVCSAEKQQQNLFKYKKGLLQQMFI